MQPGDATDEHDVTSAVDATAGEGHSAPTRRATMLAAWLGLILIVSIAGAGLILSLDHPPTDEGRPELTYRGHAIVAPRLATMDHDLQLLADAADGVAAAGRETLTRLRALDTVRVDQALTAGAAAATDAAAVRDRLLVARATLLDGTGLTQLPTADRSRIAAIDSALIAVGELQSEWEQVALTASGPLDLLRSMAAHDASVVAATDAGVAGDWATALASLSEAQRLLVPAHAVRDQARKAGRDVSTLTDLLDRLDTYDSALTDLYASLQASNGTQTPASEALLEQVNAAQQSLPADQTAMVVIISDLAGPTITPVLLAIETARGALESAIDAEPQPSGAGPAALGAAGRSGAPVRRRRVILIATVGDRSLCRPPVSVGPDRPRSPTGCRPVSSSASPGMSRRTCSRYPSPATASRPPPCSSSTAASTVR